MGFLVAPPIKSAAFFEVGVEFSMLSGEHVIFCNFSIIYFAYLNINMTLICDFAVLRVAGLNFN